MKVLIIGGTKNQVTDETRAYYQKYIDFFEASVATTSINTIIESSQLDDLLISVGDGEFTIYDVFNEHDLSYYDVLLLRFDNSRNYLDLIGSINAYAELNHLTVINTHKDIKDSSKLLQAVYFHILNIPVARTLYVNSSVIKSETHLGWEFPCVMKATYGSHGNDNYVVDSMKDVQSHLDLQPGKRFVLQRFVQNTGDYRILVVSDEVLLIGRSAVGDSHLNNTSKGGEATLVDLSQLPQGVINDAKRVMKYLGLIIAGVDVLADKYTNEFYFLEVNSQPQLMSGAFIAEKELLVGKLFESLSHKG